MHAVARRQHRRIGAQPPDRRFPHQVRGRVEHQVQVDVAQEPGRVRELVVELTGAPAGVAGDDARARRGVRFEDLAQQRLRRGQEQSVADELEVLGRFVAEKDPAALRFDRAANPQRQVVSPRRPAARAAPSCSPACRWDDSGRGRTPPRGRSRTGGRRSSRSSDPGVAASTAAGPPGRFRHQITPPLRSGSGLRSATGGQVSDPP